ncbi:MAG: ATP-binding protein [Candidatus Jordarchaeales archaeon]
MSNRVFLDPAVGFYLDELETTMDVLIPSNPLDRVIGQDHAVKMAKLAVRQRRHLLLVGYPGVGKSMIAKAVAFLLPPPKEEVWVVHNPKNPERPLVEVVRGSMRSGEEPVGQLVKPRDIPFEVAVRLGYRCKNCGMLSSAASASCPYCGDEKEFEKNAFSSPFRDLYEKLVLPVEQERLRRVVPHTVKRADGKEEVVVYEAVHHDPEGPSVRFLRQSDLEALGRSEKSSPRKILVPLNRKTFVQATGASETELLGDVLHDPYGSHPELGTPPYKRVVAGAVHEAHEGVLYVDELPHLGHLQSFLLTAMQDKKFPITGRNPQSSGSNVRVDGVPCDFMFIGACNIQDLPAILSPLRSRIQGNGYEILLNSTMPDTPENRAKIAQFVAQEVVSDGRIPHATREAVEELVKEAVRRAEVIDGEKNAITLRLRDLGGVVRMAGDLAVEDDCKLIERRHMRDAIRICVPVEEQVKRQFGSIEKAIKGEIMQASNPNSSYSYIEGLARYG